LPGGEPCMCSVSPYRAPDGAVIGAVLVLRRDGEGCLAGSEGLAARTDVAGHRGV
ncbi:histidine kinase, partial [Desulfovibrio oxamicus]|nr:histidine kinase [Nitratidesulfovibrio oxamicus]